MFPEKIYRHVFGDSVLKPFVLNSIYVLSIQIQKKNSSGCFF